MDANGLPVPEAFAKHMFKGLASSLVYLQHGIHEFGDVRRPERRSGQWTPTWHCDITINSVSLQIYPNDVVPVAK